LFSSMLMCMSIDPDEDERALIAFVQDHWREQLNAYHAAHPTSLFQESVPGHVCNQTP
jgi:hypothetical protein